MARLCVDFARLLLFGAVIGSSFGLACNSSPDVSLETYNDSAAEDYGCIVGDLECECAAGDKCDDFLTCQQGICRCITPECKEPPPTTGDGDMETSGSETAGDGDGDTGDGDGDTGDGDGDSGDGDGDTGDGDGDGDGDTGDGDGDGDGDTGDGDGDGEP